MTTDSSMERGCLVEGCGRPHKGHGYCDPHLAAEQDAGRLVRGVGVCTFPGCSRGQHAKDLCMGHYQQQRKGGPLTELRPTKKRGEFRACDAGGCGRPAQARGLCIGHYRQRSRGRTLTNLPATSGVDPPP